MSETVKPPGVDELEEAEAQNKRTVEVLQSIKPTRLADIEEQERQLRTATKLGDLIASIKTTLK